MNNSTMSAFPPVIPPPPPQLDDMLTREQCAAWMGMSSRELMAKSRGNRAPIPAFRPSPKLIRYHPRTIIAKLAAEAGVPERVIAASFGLHVDRKEGG